MNNTRRLETMLVEDVFDLLLVRVPEQAKEGRHCRLCVVVRVGGSDELRVDESALFAALLNAEQVHEVVRPRVLDHKLSKRGRKRENVSKENYGRCRLGSEVPDRQVSVVVVARPIVLTRIHWE